MEQSLSGPARWLLAADKRLFRFESQLNLIAALVIFGVMLIGVAQVIGRKLLNFPVPGYIDVIEIVMGVFAFLSIAYTQRLGGHVRMEILLKKMKGRSLWVVEAIGTAIIIVIIVILAWFGYEHFLRAWLIGDSTIDADLPLWPSKLLVPVAFVVLLARLFIQFAGFVRLSLHPDAEPVGIPLIESVDEMAQHEIDAGLAGEKDAPDLVGRDSAEHDGGRN